MVKSFNLRNNPNIKERLLQTFRSVYANTSATVAVDVCGDLCARVSVGSLNGEVITNHNYHEKLALHMIFIPQEDRRLLAYLILDGKYAAGRNPPADNGFQYMDGPYSSELYTYLEKLSEGLR